MSLNENTLHELEKELLSLKSQLATAESRVGDLRREILSLENYLNCTKGKPSAASLNVAEAPRGDERETQEVSDGGGFRSLLQKALKENPKGLRPKEVTQALEGMGYAPKGNTPLSIRVSTELSRMVRTKAGVIRRRGKYVFTERNAI